MLKQCLAQNAALSVLLLLCCSAIKPLLAQTTEVRLHVNQQLHGQAMVYGTLAVEDEYQWFPTRIEYYLSQLEIQHDGGQWTAVEDTWLLLDAGSDITVSLGSFAIAQVEGIRFWVGVETPTNNEDPSVYPMDHPLALQSPSMHWGWSAGYRFVCMEGQAGGDISGHFEFHGLGNANYHMVELAGTPEDLGGIQTFYIDADYAKAVADFDLSTGPFHHGETGDAAAFLLAFAERVFSPAEGPQVPNGLPSASGEGYGLEVLGNPVHSGSGVRYRLPEGRTGSIMIVDRLGRTLHEMHIDRGEGIWTMPELPAGAYHVVLASDGPVLQRKILVP
jgi:hypothetical protein